MNFVSDMLIREDLGNVAPVSRLVKLLYSKRSKEGLWGLLLKLEGAFGDGSLYFQFLTIYS